MIPTQRPLKLNCLKLLQSYDAAEYDKLAAGYENLNWRMISKPGGATVKPDDFYSLYGCLLPENHLRVPAFTPSITLKHCSQ